MAARGRRRGLTMPPEPHAQNPLLAALGVLIGTWEGRASLGGQTTAVSRAQFEWIEGGSFVIHKADADAGALSDEWIEHSPFPIRAIIGADDRSEEYAYVYADARGVARVYRMTLREGTWKIWGQAGPQFYQRFAGTFGDGGETIDGRWERSTDGSRWELDFALTYTRVA